MKLLAAVVACSQVTSPSSNPAVDAAASSASRDALADDEDSGSNTGPKDSGTSSPLEPTMRTALKSMIGTIARDLDRSQWGTTTIDGGTGIYLEAHKGGDPACPTSSSPTPDYTLIVANVPRGPAGSKYTMADGVRVAYFDFKGDQITDAGGSVNPIIRATSASVTIVAIDPAAQGSVEVEVDAVFASGTVSGRAYATFCQSLSD